MLCAICKFQKQHRREALDYCGSKCIHVFLWISNYTLTLQKVQLLPPRLPWWLSGKESTASSRDADLIPGLGRSPGEGNGNPLRYSCLEKSYGQRSLATVHGAALPTKNYLHCFKYCGQFIAFNIFLNQNVRSTWASNIPLRFCAVIHSSSLPRWAHGLLPVFYYKNFNELF